MWRDKANQIIARECLAAYREANEGRKRHIPYRVPPIAQALVDCLREGDEERAKAIFVGIACGSICNQTI